MKKNISWELEKVFWSGFLHFFSGQLFFDKIQKCYFWLKKIPKGPFLIWPLTVSRDTFHFPWTRKFSLFSVFRVVQGEAKTPKIMGCCKAIFAFLHALKIGTFRGKWTLEWVFRTSQFFRLALYFLINSKLAFLCMFLNDAERELQKKFWFRAQNSVKNDFLLLRLETSLAWKFLFLCSFLKNHPWMFEKNSFFNKLWA